MLRAMGNEGGASYSGGIVWLLDGAIVYGDAATCRKGLLEFRPYCQMSSCSTVCHLNCRIADGIMLLMARYQAGRFVDIPGEMTTPFLAAKECH